MLPFGKQQEILTFLSTTNPEEIWLDKASATRQYTGAGCAIKSYALSNQKMSSLGKGRSEDDLGSKLNLT
jgi:hypothetical protein